MVEPRIVILEGRGSNPLNPLLNFKTQNTKLKMKISTTTSLSTSVWSMVGALQATEAMLGPNRQWKGDSEQHQWMINLFTALQKETTTLPELEAIASTHASEINQFLADRGFNITINELNANEFATAAVLSVLIEWKVEGERTKHSIGGARYDFVKMKNTEAQINFMPPPSDFAAIISDASTAKENYIVSVATKREGERAYFMMSEKAPESIQELVDTINRLRVEKSSPKFLDSKTEFYFPMVELDQEIEEEQGLNCLIGLQTFDTTDNPWEVRYAKQQNILKINEKGALAKSATVITTRGGFAMSDTENMIIDKPFYFWIEREDLSEPLFTAYITAENWIDPGDLN